MPAPSLTLEDQRRWARRLEHGRLAELAIEPGIDLPGPGAAPKATAPAGAGQAGAEGGLVGAAMAQLDELVEKTIVHKAGWGSCGTMMGALVGIPLLNAYLIMSELGVELRSFASLAPMLLDLLGLETKIPKAYKLPKMHVWDKLGILGVDALIALVILGQMVIIGVLVYYVTYCFGNPLECTWGIGSAFF